MQEIKRVQMREGQGENILDLIEELMNALEEHENDDTIDVVEFSVSIGRSTEGD